MPTAHEIITEHYRRKAAGEAHTGLVVEHSDAEVRIGLEGFGIVHTDSATYLAAEAANNWGEPQTAT